LDFLRPPFHDLKLTTQLSMNILIVQNKSDRFVAFIHRCKNQGQILDNLSTLISHLSGSNLFFRSTAAHLRQIHYLRCGGVLTKLVKVNTCFVTIQSNDKISTKFMFIYFSISFFCFFIECYKHDSLLFPLLEINQGKWQNTNTYQNNTQYNIPCIHIYLNLNIK